MPDAWPEPAVLLPHQPPMRLLDRIVGWFDGTVEAQVDVAPEVSFFRPGRGIPAWIGVEYLAQAAAVCFGLAARTRGDAAAAPVPGMLVASRTFHCLVSHFPEGATLTVRVTPASALSAALVRFAGEIELGPECLARGEVSVYRQLARAGQPRE